LGVTFGIPFVKRPCSSSSSISAIRVNFIYKENTYNYKKRSNPEVKISMKEIELKRKGRNKKPSVIIENIEIKHNT